MANTLKIPPFLSTISKPSKDAKEFKEENLELTSKSPPMLFKPLKPLKEDKEFKEGEEKDLAITLKFPPIVSKLSKPSKDAKEFKEENLEITSKYHQMINKKNILNNNIKIN